jgi:hypothetical protein
MRILGSGNVGIGQAAPQNPLEVDLNQSNGTLTGDSAVHFGGPHHTTGQIMGITLGYRESNASYRKVGIVAAGLSDSEANQDFHILVNTANSAASCSIADKKLSIYGTTGIVRVHNKFGIGGDPGTHHLYAAGTASIAGALTVGANTTLSTNVSGHTLFGNNTANKDVNYTVTGTGGHYFSGSLVRILSSVGIGTTPDSGLVLTVYGASGNVFNVKGQGSSNVLNIGATGVHTITGSSGGTIFNLTNSGAGDYMDLGSGAFHVQKDGNVGIGTTAPGAKLMVGAPTRQAGSAVQQQAGYFVGTKTAYAGSGNKGLWQNQLHIADDSAVAAGIGGAITFGATADNTNGTYYASIEASKDNATSGNYGGSMIFRTRTHGASLMGAHMVIASDGNVGIGIVSPGSYKLNVQGLVNIGTTAAGGDLRLEGKSGSTFPHRLRTSVGGGLMFEANGVN